MSKISAVLKSTYTYRFVLGLILFSLIIAILINFLDKPGMDWMMYMKASTLYQTSSPIYNVWITQYDKGAVMYLYSPFFVFVIIPLTFLPFPVSLLLWDIIKLVMLWRFFVIIANMLDYYSLSDRKKATILLLSYLFVLRFLLYDFDLGNMTVFLLWSMVEGWHQIKRDNKIIGTLLLSIGLFIKTFSIIFIPYLIYKRQFKALSLFLLWTVILFVMPFLFDRWNYNLSLYREWIQVISPLKVSMSLVTADPSSSKIHDLHTAIPSWYAGISSFLHSFFRFNDLSTNQIGILINTTIAVFILAFLFLPGSRFFSGNSNVKLELAELSYLFATIPLIFPMQQKHAFIFMTPLIIYVIDYLVNNKVKVYQVLLCGISFLLMVISTDGIIGRSLNLITQQYKFVTLGGIILIILFFCIRYEEEKVSRGQATLKQNPAARHRISAE